MHSCIANVAGQAADRATRALGALLLRHIRHSTRKADMTSKRKIFDHGVAWEEGNSVTQGYCVNGTIYISGQFSHDQDGFADGDIEAQTRLTLENLDRVLKGFDVTKSNLAYMEIYLTNPQEHFEPFVRVFKEHLQ